jgi:hypothetical protein
MSGGGGNGGEVTACRKRNRASGRSLVVAFVLRLISAASGLRQLTSAAGALEF